MPTRTQYAKDEITSIGKNFLKKNPEYRVARRRAGPVAINARRLVYEDANHCLRTATPHSPSVDGVIAHPNALGANKTGYIVKKGPALLYSQSSLEVGEFKVAEDGRIVNFIKNVDSGRTVLAATNGEDDEITVGAGAANDETLTIISNNTADITQIVTIYGIEKTTGTILVETATLNGTTGVVVSTSLYNEVLGSTISATALGTVLIKNTTTGTTLISHATTVNDRGIIDLTAADTWKGYDRKFAFTISALEAVDVIVEGYDLGGNILRETLTWKAANEALVKETVNRYQRITRLLYGDLAAAKTMAVAGIATNDMITDFVNNASTVTTISATDQGADSKIEIVSDEATDIGMKVKVCWKTAAGVWSISEMTLNGTTHVQITAAGDTVIGAYVSSGTPIGALTIEYDRGGGGAADVLVFDCATTLSAGMLGKEDSDLVYVAKDIAGNDSPVTFTNSNGASTVFVYVDGEDVDGTSQGEGITLVAGTLATTKSYSRILNIFASGAAATEYWKISNETEDDGNKKLGRVYEPADAQDTKVECELY